MTNITNPLNEQEVTLEKDEELVDLLTEIDKEPQTADSNQETVEEDVLEASDEVTEDTEEPKELEGKYAGKSIDEVVQMHQEAEKLVGRQGAEVGELRKIVDEFIKNKVSETKENLSNTDNVDEPDFFDNPKEAVEVLGKLTTKHPDYVEIVKDPAFGQWVNGSKVRVELLQRADKFDFDAADELLSFWKERKGMVDTAKAVNSEDRKQT